MNNFLSNDGLSPDIESHLVKRPSDSWRSDIWPSNPLDVFGGTRCPGLIGQVGATDT
jgi:hypothetical protein